jgi:DNA (cytosine-5)-methyltransferase 1
VKPRAIDVCAGCGGLSLGLKRAGFDVLGVEHMREPVIIHRRYVGPCDLADITRWHPPHDADLVIGGVPCQPFSTQGKRGGLSESVGSLFPDVAEPRAQLYKHLLRIAVEANARACALENVRGLLSWNDGEAFRQIEAAFHEAGFVHTSHALLDAVSFGVPQHRLRVFLVGFRDEAAWGRFHWPEPTHRQLDDGSGRPTWRTVRQALGLGKGEFHRSTGSQGQRAIDVDRPANTIGASNNADLLVPADDDAARCLRRIGEQLDAANLLDKPTTTISAGGEGRLARPGHKVDGDQWNGCVRLTAAQCALLQDFPPEWEWPKNAEDAHTMIGNAVPSGLAEAVAGSLAAALG